jgi:hypothetical protein
LKVLQLLQLSFPDLITFVIDVCFWMRRGAETHASPTYSQSRTNSVSAPVGQLFPSPRPEPYLLWRLSPRPRGQPSPPTLTPSLRDGTQRRPPGAPRASGPPSAQRALLRGGSEALRLPAEGAGPEGAGPEDEPILGREYGRATIGPPRGLQPLRPGSVL